LYINTSLRAPNIAGDKPRLEKAGMSELPGNLKRRSPLYVAIMTGGIAASGLMVTSLSGCMAKATETVNPTAVKNAAAKVADPCNPCAAKACNPCAAKACNPCNPCAAKACNPCNPCAAKACKRRKRVTHVTRVQRTPVTRAILAVQLPLTRAILSDRQACFLMPARR